MKTEQIADNIVRSEVICNVSHLVSELSQIDKFTDEIAAICVADDWESPVFEYLANEATPVEMRELIEDLDLECEPDYRAIIRVMDADEDRERLYREAAEFMNLDPQVSEALEHWIVSDWLASRLEEHGEMVARDFYGLNLWGRTTSGQAVSMDGVIQRIAGAT